MQNTNYMHASLTDTVEIAQEKIISTISTADTDPELWLWCENHLGEVIIPILIFALGYFISICIDKYKKRNELYLYKCLFLEWVKSIKPKLSSYIEKLDEFAADIRVNTGLNISQYTSTIIPISGLRNIPVDKITDALILNSNIKTRESALATKNMYDIISALEFIEENQKFIWMTYKEYTQAVNDNRAIWNDNMRTLHRLVSDADSNNCNSTEIEFTNAISGFYEELFQKYGRDKSIDLNIWKPEFIDRVAEIYTTYSALLNGSEYVTKILHCINNLFFVCRQQDAIKNYSEVFKKMNSSMKHVNKTIDDSVAFFEEKRLKRFWNMRL